ncbi:adenylate/guanylate cyclase domain-containing protein [Robertkochia aurantiaca]|uniref:adenylate/guanylate cyclase domain-containing protein n=1 Tax=Robertkochia aurantiaca TaxID=2873700 RepID=UPI001CCDB74B|nr:adenylate/guanylate cyclase domain-containing protein [Robertkochia sp. 3YJGBD-33]
MNASVTYMGLNRTVLVEDDASSLLDISLDNQIPHMHECGGYGRCTTCRVRIVEGSQNLSRRNRAEQEMAQSRNWDPTIRLACQTYLKGNVSLQRLIWSMGEVNQLQKELAPEGKAEERSIAILFCDLRNFTSLSSANLNFDLAFMLNKFYTALGEPILMNNGIIYQYVGDEIVGVFGTTGGNREKNCTDAIRAALGMQFALSRLNKMELEDFKVELKSGIGINFGKAYVGHLGHPTHRQFSVIGDPVNVASRIQEQTKVHNARILISESVLKGIREQDVEIARSFKTLLSGKENICNLFEVLGFKEMDMKLELQASLHQLLEDQERFASLFYEKLFQTAPSVRALFKRDMTEQGRLLTHMLGGLVYSMSRPDYFHSGLKNLGINHQKYGVKPEHYPIVKTVLISTIQEVLGEEEDGNSKVLSAWSEALNVVLEAMKPLPE